DRITIGGGVTGQVDQFKGKTLTAVARELGVSPSTALVELVVRDRATVLAFREFGSEDDLVLALVQPWTAMCTDFAAPAVGGPVATGWPHPRAFGTTARILGRYVREQRLLTLEEAVRKMTSLPAQRAAPRGARARSRQARRARRSRGHRSGAGDRHRDLR